MILHFQILPVAASAIETTSSFSYEKWCFMWFYKLQRSYLLPEHVAIQGGEEEAREISRRGDQRTWGSMKSTGDMNGGCGEQTAGGGEWGERKKRDRWALRRKEMRAEERRNQRHTRGRDANPIRSLETPANVTVRALEEDRGLMCSSKGETKWWGRQSFSTDNH